MLYSGARSALVSLWDVHDKSTSTFMTALYRRLEIDGHRALAVRQAMIDTRREYPNPYHWAPFMLIGNWL